MSTDKEFRDHIFTCMSLVKDGESENPVSKEVLEMLKVYVKGPHVNKVCIEEDGDGIAPIHLAGMLGNVTLLELFKNNGNIDVNVKFYKKGKEMGNVLDLVAAKSKTIKLEVMKTVLELNDIEITQFEKEFGSIPDVLDRAVESDREDLVLLLLSKEKTFPQLNHPTAVLCCIANDNMKLFVKLLPKIDCDWRPPGMQKCFLCKVSADVSLLHFSICWRKPKFLGCLLQSGWEASSVRPSSGLTPLQDAVATFHHGVGPVTEDCSTGVCLEMLRELVSAPSVDLTVCVEKGGKQMLALEVALQGSTAKHCKATICNPTKKFLKQQLKKINQKQKISGRKDKEKSVMESSRLEKTCWKCLKSADAEKLFQCADCREAWYCGLVCQRGDWEEHWQRCQEKHELRKREQKEKENEKYVAFSTGSLASALD